MPHVRSIARIGGAVSVAAETEATLVVQDHLRAAGPCPRALRPFGLDDIKFLATELFSVMTF